MAKLVKCGGCPEAALDIRTMKAGTPFMDDGDVYIRTTIPIGTEGAVVRLSDGAALGVVNPQAWSPAPLDSDYLIPKEQ